MPPLVQQPMEKPAPQGVKALSQASAPAIYRPQLPAHAAIDFLVKGPSPAVSRRICGVLYFLAAVCLAVIVGEAAAVAFALMSGLDTALKVTIIGAATYLFILGSTPTIVAIQRWRRDHPTPVRVKAQRRP